MGETKIKVLMAKPGLEGHWRGIMAVSKALRDAGMEIVYGGNMLPPEIAQTAVQEDVNVVGLSILSANYMRLTSATIEELKKAGRGDAMLLLGGIIYKEDFEELKKMGVAGIFLPGTPLEDIVKFIQENTPQAVARA